MNDKIKNILTVITMSWLIFGLSLWCILKENTDYSQSERRYLKEFPKVNTSSILNGSFMSEYESYAADQFPKREAFRTAKSFSDIYLLRKLDSDGLYNAKGHIAKIDYPINKESIENAADKFKSIYESYLKGTNTNIYFSIIPDKSFYLADSEDILSDDFKTFENAFCPNMTFAEYIKIDDLLDETAYYKTDTHWKQEAVIPVANRLLEKMGVKIGNVHYETKILPLPFYGVLYGQLGMHHKPDTIKYLENDMLRKCSVISYSTGIPKDSVLYNMDKAQGKDPYEMFLSGSEALITIENTQNNAADNELIIFRDSFASSIAPIMMSGYKKITLIDIRYMQREAIERFIHFDDQNVLFLYSTMMLNNSFSLK